MARHLNEMYFDPEWHAHSEYQLFMVLKGTGTRFVGDSIRTFYPGELIFTGPHLPHIWRSDDAYFDPKNALEAEGIVVYFNEDFLDAKWMAKEEMKSIQKLFSRSKRGIEFLGTEKEKIYPYLASLPYSSGFSGLLQLLHILEILAESKQFQYLSSRTFEEEVVEETGRMNQVYDYIMNHFRQKISLDEVADLLHMTPASFSRFFSRKHGKPLTQFLSELRIRHACSLLIGTDKLVEEICYECGFSTLSNFNKQFKQITQKKPLQYRKEFLGL